MTDIVQKIIDRVRGTSDVADALLERHYSTPMSVEAASSESEEADDNEALLDDVLRNQVDGSGEDTIRKLSKVILMLSDEISNLNRELDVLQIDRPDLTDDEIAPQIIEFRTNLKGKRSGDLKMFYDKAVFKPMRKKTRCLIAKELMEYVTTQGKEPAELWLNIVNKTGAL